MIKKIVSIVAGLIIGATGAMADTISEDFEDNGLHSAITVSKTGSFKNNPGIKSITEFGSNYAFGFGRSTCGASCSTNYQSSLVIKFASPTLVKTISFKNMELYGDWGSVGYVFLDGESYEAFRPTTNTHNADTTYRTYSASINQTVSEIELRVWDITTQSEIFIDDLVIVTASSCNDRYSEGYSAGKAYCQSNPSACGISTGGTTVVSSEDDISIDITSSWQLVGTSGTIAVSDFSSFFDSDCVSKVYYFNGSWYPYVPGSSTSGLINIGPDQGFWIKGKKSCTLSNLRYTEEQCNLSYPSFSASDKAWCDAHYY